MEDRFNPQIPYGIAWKVGKERENAYTLYWDFVIDGTASMVTLYPAVYLAVSKFIEWMKRYEVKPMLGITVIRSDERKAAEAVEFEKEVYYTEDSALFLKKIKYLPLYGGNPDADEAVTESLSLSLSKFPKGSLNRGIMVFTDSYHCSHNLSLKQYPVGAVTFFAPEELALEPFDFFFQTPEGENDEEGSASFYDIRCLFEELSGDFLDDVVKPFKDLIKGVSIGA